MSGKAENPGAEEDVHFVIARYTDADLPNERLEARQLLAAASKN